jgi:hypothetical protein
MTAESLVSPAVIDRRYNGMLDAKFFAARFTLLL